MTRIIEHREDILPGEDVFEFRVFKTPDGQRRAYIIPIDATINHAVIAEVSALVEQAFLYALAFCEREQNRDPVDSRPAPSVSAAGSAGAAGTMS